MPRIGEVPSVEVSVPDAIDERIENCACSIGMRSRRICGSMSSFDAARSIVVSTSGLKTSATASCSARSPSEAQPDEQPRGNGIIGEMIEEHPDHLEDDLGFRIPPGQRRESEGAELDVHVPRDL